MVGLALALLVAAPTLGPGATLVYDMVFVPAPELGPRAWGADGSVPRAVPMDAVLALLHRLAVPSSLVQGAALLAIVLVAFVGAWRAAPAASLPGAAATAVVYAWNPYVGERLAMGHWSLLLGYALLPWVLLTALPESWWAEGGRPPATVDPGDARSRGARLVVLAGLASVLAPTSSLLVAGASAVLLVAGGPLASSWRRRGVLLVALVAVQLPWVVPGLLATTLTGSGEGAADAGVLAFAARPDTPLGGVVSVLTGGGTWNVLVHLASRRAGLAVAGFGVLLLLGVVALVRLALRPPAAHGAARGPAVALLVLGVLGVAIPLLSLTAAGRALLGDVVGAVPALGVLRDAQKWSAWWLLAAAPGVGLAAERAAGRLPRGHAEFVAVCLALLPMTTSPDLAWGVGGRLQRAEWPAEYTAVAERLDSAPPGAVLVLPWHAFRAWPWNEDRTVLDPWQRLVSRRVVVDDELELDTLSVPGEDPLASAAAPLVLADGGADPAALRELGIRYVVLDRATAGQRGSVDADAGTATVHSGPLLEVLDLGPVTPPAAPSFRRTSLVVVGDAVAGTTVLTAGAVWLSGRRARRSRKRV